MIDVTEKYRTRCGFEWRFYADDGAGEYSIHGAIKSEKGWRFVAHTKLGFADKDGRPHPHDLIKDTPYSEFKIGDPVMVSATGGFIWERRYFAGVREGLPSVFDDGRTQWSSNGETSVYKACRKPTDEELHDRATD